MRSSFFVRKTSAAVANPTSSTTCTRIFCAAPSTLSTTHHFLCIHLHCIVSYLNSFCVGCRDIHDASGILRFSHTRNRQCVRCHHCKQSDKTRNKHKTSMKTRFIISHGASIISRMSFTSQLSIERISIHFIIEVC